MKLSQWLTASPVHANAPTNSQRRKTCEMQVHSQVSLQKVRIREKSYNRLCTIPQIAIRMVFNERYKDSVQQIQSEKKDLKEDATEKFSKGYCLQYDARTSRAN